MKKTLLLMMLCCPIVLAAQNGVTVSNLAMSNGTVTFNVSWDNIGMPDVWSDTVWVWVDYNNAGKMERLPLLSGATLTATSPGGKVIEEPDNNQGMWVAGNAREEGAFSATVQLLTAIADFSGACAYASNYPPVRKYISASEISFTGTPPYDVVLKDNSGGTETRTENSPYIVPAGYTVQSFTDKTGAPGIILGGIFQLQGNCTYTEPAVMGTFASFDPSYSASTYVSLTDERDNKNYPIVKIGGYWIMARNLNYQKDLTWQEYSNKPSTTEGQDLELIGHFWCPGAIDAGTSTRTACEVYGALYSWETAMMLDGYGTWTEAGTYTYSTGVMNTDTAKINQGRTTHSGNVLGGRGICPPHWHVPTIFEWCVIFDIMVGGGTAHQSITYRGEPCVSCVAGEYGKSSCVGTIVDDDLLWPDNEYNRGADDYGFRGLPASNRIPNGEYYQWGARFWSSTVGSDWSAWYVGFRPEWNASLIWANERSNGMSVRCIRD